MRLLCFHELVALAIIFLLTIFSTVGKVAFIELNINVVIFAKLYTNCRTKLKFNIV